MRVTPMGLALAAVLALGGCSGGASAPAGPPHVVSTTPALVSTVPASTDHIAVTFDRPMSRGWSFVLSAGEPFPALVGDPSLSADGRTISTAVRLEPGVHYTVWLNSLNYHNFRDPTGTPATPYKLTFSTGP